MDLPFGMRARRTTSHSSRCRCFPAEQPRSARGYAGMTLERVRNVRLFVCAVRDLRLVDRALAGCLRRGARLPTARGLEAAFAAHGRKQCEGEQAEADSQRRSRSPSELLCERAAVATHGVVRGFDDDDVASSADRSKGRQGGSRRLEQRIMVVWHEQWWRPTQREL